MDADRKRTFDAFEQELSDTELHLDAEITDAISQDATRIQNVRRRLDAILQNGAALSRHLRAVQLQIAADEERRRKEHDAAAAPEVARMASNLARMPVGVLSLILTEAMRPAHFVAPAFYRVMMCPWQTARVLREEPHSPAFTVRAEREVRQLRTVCKSFAAALEHCYEFQLCIRTDMQNALVKRSEMRVMRTNLYALRWPGIRVLHITLDQFSAAFRGRLEAVLFHSTSQLKQHVPNLAAIVIDARYCTDVLKSNAHSGDLLAPALVYRARRAAVPAPMQTYVFPANLYYFKSITLPVEFARWHSYKVRVLAIDRFDDEQLAKTPYNWPTLQHLILRRVKAMHTYLTAGVNLVKYPMLRALTYAPWLLAGNIHHNTALGHYLNDLRLSADMGNLWHTKTKNRMMLDMHAFYRTCCIANAKLADIRNDYADPDALAAELETAALQLISSVPLVLLFPRASVCAAYVPDAAPYEHGPARVPFVSFLQQYGDRIHVGSRLQIVESAFMQHLVNLGEPLPSIELEQLAAPRGSAVTHWLQRHLSYSPAFEETL